MHHTIIVPNFQDTIWNGWLGYEYQTHERLSWLATSIQFYKLYFANVQDEVDVDCIVAHAFCVRGYKLEQPDKPSGCHLPWFHDHASWFFLLIKPGKPLQKWTEEQSYPVGDFIGLDLVEAVDNVNKLIWTNFS